MSFVDPQIYLDLDKQLEKDIKLYFSYGSRDMKQVRKWAAKLQLCLSAIELDNLEWSFEIHEGQNHNTSAAKAFSSGLFY